MSRFFSILTKQKKLFNERLLFVSKRSISGFTYLLPDIPKDNPETNFLLDLPKNGEIVDFFKTTPILTFNAFIKSLIELDISLQEIDELTNEEIENLTFDKFYKPFDEKICQLNYTWSVFELMTKYEPEKYHLRKFGFINCLNNYKSIMDKRFFNENLYKIMLKFYNEQDKLSLQQLEIVKKYILNARLNGLDSKNKSLIILQKKEIKKFEDIFVYNYFYSLNSYKHNVSDIEYYDKVPKSLSWIKDKGYINLNPQVFSHFLTYCNYTIDRQKVWEENNKKASIVNNIKFSNNLNLDEIIIGRRRLAEHLGFKNYIEYVLQSRTFDSISFIGNFLEEIFAKSRKTFGNDISELVWYSSKNINFYSERLNLWDLPYFLKLCKQDHLNTKKEINSYFTFDKVFSGILQFLNQNLDITIVKDESSKLSNENSKFYNVYYKRNFIGNFLLNHLAEIPEFSFNILTDRSDYFQIKPSASLLFNFVKSNESNDVNLTFHQVANIFKYFGYLVDHLLINNSYAESSGINNRSLDTFNLTANLFILFFINEYDLVKNCSSHLSNEDPIPEEYFHHLKNNLLKFESINLSEKIYYSVLDISLYTNNDYWYDIQKSVWEKYMAPFSFGKNNFHLCSAIDLICGNKAGGYYCDLYCEILASNLYTNSKKNNQSIENFFKNYVSQLLLNENNLNEKQIAENLLGQKLRAGAYLDLLNI